MEGCGSAPGPLAKHFDILVGPDSMLIIHQGDIPVRYGLGVWPNGRVQAASASTSITNESEGFPNGMIQYSMPVRYGLGVLTDTKVPAAAAELSPGTQCQG